MLKHSLPVCVCSSQLGVPGSASAQPGGIFGAKQQVIAAGETDFGKSKAKFCSADELFRSGIQGVRIAAVEGVRIDYGDEKKD